MFKRRPWQMLHSSRTNRNYHARVKRYFVSGRFLVVKGAPRAPSTGTKGRRRHIAVPPTDGWVAELSDGTHVTAVRSAGAWRAHLEVRGRGREIRIQTSSLF